MNSQASVDGVGLNALSYRIIMRNGLIGRVKLHKKQVIGIEA